jgi:hypothetical protein
MGLDEIRYRNEKLRAEGKLPGAKGTTTVGNPLLISQERRPLPCVHEGAVLEYCKTCNGSRAEGRHVRDCDLHEKCTRGYVSHAVKWCGRCSDYKPLEEKVVEVVQSTPLPAPITPPPISTTASTIPIPQLKSKRGKGPTWAYGVTTVPERRRTLLPHTLRSLAAAGFDSPRLFVDGEDDPRSWKDEFKLEVVARYPNIRTYGNWILSLAELYIREPRRTYYAMFQDDFVTYKNLRGYLDAIDYPQQGYLNLYTFPKNQVRVPSENFTGFYPSNQKGLGAVALVFSEEAVITLLASQHMVMRPRDAFRGHKAVDGGIVTALQQAGYKEYVHNPSLVQHTGLQSSMRNHRHPLATSFRGEEYDALSLLSRGSDEEQKGKDRK